MAYPAGTRPISRKFWRFLAMYNRLYRVVWPHLPRKYYWSAPLVAGTGIAFLYLFHIDPRALSITKPPVTLGSNMRPLAHLHPPFFTAVKWCFFQYDTALLLACKAQRTH